MDKLILSKENSVFTFSPDEFFHSSFYDLIISLLKSGYRGTFFDLSSEEMLLTYEDGFFRLMKNEDRIFVSSDFNPVLKIAKENFNFIPDIICPKCLKHNINYKLKAIKRGKVNFGKLYKLEVFCTSIFDTKNSRDICLFNFSQKFWSNNFSSNRMAYKIIQMYFKHLYFT